jgi:hypothetical protein
MARPKIVVDEAKIEALAAVGCPAKEIADALSLSERTLERRYGALMRKGFNRGMMRLRSVLFNMALKGNLGAVIFALKAYCGLRDDAGMNINVSAHAHAQADARSPEQIKEHLVQLQRAVFAEAHRQNGDN